MALRLVQVNLKARDDRALARFWAQALGWAVLGGQDGATGVLPAGAEWPLPSTVNLDVIRVHNTGTVRDRAHLELATGSAAARAELLRRLRELGATPVAEDPARTVLSDPEGNAFCVLAPAGEQDGLVGRVVVDCADPLRLSRFWSEALGWPVVGPTADRAVLRGGTGPALELSCTPHVPYGWTRLHLDLLPTPVTAGADEVARLEGLGATRADVGQGEVPWTVLADPEGNAFCVLGPG